METLGLTQWDHVFTPIDDWPTAGQCWIGVKTLVVVAPSLALAFRPKRCTD